MFIGVVQGRFKNESLKKALVGLPGLFDK